MMSNTASIHTWEGCLECGASGSCSVRIMVDDGNGGIHDEREFLDYLRRMCPCCEHSMTWLFRHGEAEVKDERNQDG